MSNATVMEAVYDISDGVVISSLEPDGTIHVTHTGQRVEPPTLRVVPAGADGGSCSLTRSYVALSKLCLSRRVDVQVDDIAEQAVRALPRLVGMIDREMQEYVGLVYARLKAAEARADAAEARTRLAEERALMAEDQCASLKLQLRARR